MVPSARAARRGCGLSRARAVPPRGLCRLRSLVRPPRRLLRPGECLRTHPRWPPDPPATHRSPRRIGGDRACLRNAAAVVADAGREGAARGRRSRAHPIRRSFLAARSEEHTSELQSLMRISYAVFCLKKKKQKKEKIKS